MNCLVLGGAGFIGSHIVDALLNRGHKVRVFDRTNVDPTNLLGSMPYIEFSCGDFTNLSDLAGALAGMEVVIHLISTTIPKTSNEDPIYDVETNISGTIKLLSLAKDMGIKKIVFPSSGGTIYGEPSVLPIPETHPTNPICSHGITKLAIEKYLHLFRHLYDLDFIILRIANAYGERQNPSGGLGAVTTFLSKILVREPIMIWGDGTIVRDYLHISDLAAVFVKVIEDTTPSRIYNVGGGKPHTLNDILAAIQVVTRRSPVVSYAPARKFDVTVSYLDISRAETELSWTPKVTLEQGISRTWAWLNAHREMNKIALPPELIGTGQAVKEIVAGE